MQSILSAVRRNIPEILAGLLIAAALGLLIYRYVTTGSGFCPIRAFGAETIIVACLTGATGLLIGKWLTERDT